jgi:hypothetical protein
LNEDEAISPREWDDFMTHHAWRWLVTSTEIANLNFNKTFELADVNQDGWITRAEFAAAERTDPPCHIGRIDPDGEGSTKEL